MTGEQPFPRETGRGLMQRQAFGMRKANGQGGVCHA
jgi:hypothetical protein